MVLCPDRSHFSAGVVTRAQAKQDDNAYRKLKSLTRFQVRTNKHSRALKCPGPLKIIIHRPDSGVVTKNYGLNLGETKIVKKRDVIKTIFTQSNKVPQQLIIPKSL